MRRALDKAARRAERILAIMSGILIAILLAILVAAAYINKYETADIPAQRTVCR